MELTMINASPRKRGNTSQLMQAFAEGFTAPNANTGANTNTVRRIDLYDLAYTGCRSCFACKLADGRSYGRCAVRDGLTDVLDGLRTTDALLIGSPIYFGSVAGALQSFLERWLFPFSTYEAGYRSLWTRRIPVHTLYTMNATPEQAAQLQIHAAIDRVEGFIAHVTGVVPVRRTVCDTCQFEDYARYRVEVFSPRHKEAVRAARFPSDLHDARADGEALARRLCR